GGAGGGRRNGEAGGGGDRQEGERVGGRADAGADAPQHQGAAGVGVAAGDVVPAGDGDAERGLVVGGRVSGVHDEGGVDHGKGERLVEERVGAAGLQQDQPDLHRLPAGDAPPGDRQVL